MGAGMEVGHISLNSEGPQCYCGQRGCAETYLSGTALNKIMDSREIFKNSLYIAIPGNHWDGHIFSSRLAKEPAMCIWV